MAIVDVPPFVLSGERQPPPHKPAEFANSDAGRQQSLFVGLGDLPGQQYLIDTCNVERGDDHE